MVVSAHSGVGDFLASGAPVTTGVEDVAETGATATFASELQPKVDDGTLVFEIGSVFDSPGSDSIEITATQTQSLLSMISMLAPSPDWVVCVRDFELFANGAWLESAQVEVVPYDAGTDSGATFTAADSDTQPKEGFSLPRDTQFSEAAASGLGTLSIERIN